MAYSNLIRESYPNLIGLVDRSEGGNDNDVKFKELKIDIRAALDAIQGNMEAGNIGDGAVTPVKLGAVTDGTTLDQSGAGSTLEIKAGGVGTTQLGAAAVTAAKLGAVTDGSTVDQNGAGSKIQIKGGGVGTTQLAAGAVTKAKTAMFVSAERVATGVAENIAHGLGGAPSVVFVSVTDTAAQVTGYTVAEGAHDGTNVVLTVTTGVKYKVMAWA